MATGSDHCGTAAAGSVCRAPRAADRPGGDPRRRSHRHDPAARAHRRPVQRCPGPDVDDRVRRRCMVQATPFLVFGVMLSAVIAVFVPASFFARALPRRSSLAVPAASVAGVVLPGCECGSVPIAGALVRRGVTPAAALAFLLSAPAINPIVLASTAVAFPGQPGMVLARCGGEHRDRLRDGLAVAAAGEDRVDPAAGPAHDRTPRRKLAGVLGVLPPRHRCTRAASWSSGPWRRPRSTSSSRGRGCEPWPDQPVLSVLALAAARGPAVHLLRGRRVRRRLADAVLAHRPARVPGGRADDRPEAVRDAGRVSSAAASRIRVRPGDLAVAVLVRDHLLGLDLQPGREVGLSRRRRL